MLFLSKKTLQYFPHVEISSYLIIMNSDSRRNLTKNLLALTCLKSYRKDKSQILEPDPSQCLKSIEKTYILCVYIICHSVLRYSNFKSFGYYTEASGEVERIPKESVWNEKKMELVRM